MKFLGFIAVIATGALLISAVDDFPDWGDPISPANSGISTHYIENTARETAVPNIVTAVLADYRSYDTMFETVVIFTAGIAILALLRFCDPTPLTPPALRSQRYKVSDSQRIIVGTTCRMLTPVIQLFALYVIAHGHHSPGGGFQGGVIFGASFILLAIAYDLPTALKRLPEKRYLFLAALGVIIYASFGIAAMALGGNFLDYTVLHKILPADPIMARSHSMLGVEIGVAFTVTTIMFATYANLSTRGRLGGSGL